MKSICSRPGVIWDMAQIIRMMYIVHINQTDAGNLGSSFIPISPRSPGWPRSPATKPKDNGCVMCWHILLFLKHFMTMQSWYTYKFLSLDWSYAWQKNSLWRREIQLRLCYATSFWILYFIPNYHIWPQSNMHLSSLWNSIFINNISSYPLMVLWNTKLHFFERKLPS